MSPTVAMIVFGVAGLLAGLLHFGLLQWSTRVLAGNGPPWVAAIAALLRILVSGLTLWLAARQGWLPLLAAAGAWTLSRALWLRRRAPA